MDRNRQEERRHGRGQVRRVEAQRIGQGRVNLAVDIDVAVVVLDHARVDGVCMLQATRLIHMNMQSAQRSSGLGSVRV